LSKKLTIKQIFLFTLKTILMKYILSIILILVFVFVAFGQTTDCSYTLEQTVQNVPSTEGTYLVKVTALFGCPVPVRSNDSFIDVGTQTPPIGTPGQLITRTILFYVYPNTGAFRTGTINISGQTLTINQAAYTKSRKRVRFFILTNSRRKEQYSNYSGSSAG
jgi:hypothetical protein